jgi:homospermidine synthase
MCLTAVALIKVSFVSAGNETLRCCYYFSVLHLCTSLEIWKCFYRTRRIQSPIFAKEECYSNYVRTDTQILEQ